MSNGEMIFRLALATLLGGLVGLERERMERAAGLRTHALVAVGSCLVMLVSAFGFSDAVTANHTVILDPSRVAAQVVSGIGFLGAGTIILRKNAVRGQVNGRTSQNKTLNFTVPSAAALQSGAYVSVIVTNSFPNSLVGEMVV